MSAGCWLLGVAWWSLPSSYRLLLLSSASRLLAPACCLVGPLVAGFLLMAALPATAHCSLAVVHMLPADHWPLAAACCRLLGAGWWFLTSGCCLAAVVHCLLPAAW